MTLWQMKTDVEIGAQKVQVTFPMVRDSTRPSVRSWVYKSAHQLHHSLMCMFYKSLFPEPGVDVLEQPLTCRATLSKVLPESSFSHLTKGLIKTIFHKSVVWKCWPILPEKPVLPSYLQRISLTWPASTYLTHSFLILTCI